MEMSKGVLHAFACFDGIVGVIFIAAPLVSNEIRDIYSIFAFPKSTG